MQVLERHRLFIAKAMIVNLSPAKSFAKPDHQATHCLFESVTLEFRAMGNYIHS